MRLGFSAGAAASALGAAFFRAVVLRGALAGFSAASAFAAGSAFGSSAFSAAGWAVTAGSAAAFLVVRGLRAAGFLTGAFFSSAGATASAAGAASTAGSAVFLAVRFARSFTSAMVHSWSAPGTSCQICSTAPASAPMPTVSTHLPPAQDERRRTVPSGVGQNSHIWEVPPTSSHRCSQVPLAVPVMVRSSSLPEARLRMRYTPSPTRTKLHSCSGLWSYLPRRTVPPSLLASTAWITLPVWAAMV